MTLVNSLRLREWLTVGEAADQLSASLNEHVNEAYVYRLALDGYLKLSVHLPPSVYATRLGNDGYAIFLDDDGEEPSFQRQLIEGLWELPLIGEGRRQMEQEFRRLRGLPSIPISGASAQSLSGKGFASICLLPGLLIPATQLLNTGCHQLYRREPLWSCEPRS